MAVSVWVVTRTVDGECEMFGVFNREEDAIESVRLSYTKETYRVRINRGRARHVVLVDHRMHDEEEWQRWDRIEIKQTEISDHVKELFNW